MHSQAILEQSKRERVQQTKASYPSARYFQIHFEFLQEQFQQTLQTLALLQLQVGQLEQRLSASKTNQEVGESFSQSVEHENILSVSENLAKQ